MLGFIVKLFVLVRKVRDVWEWLNCMHVDTSEGGAVRPGLVDCLFPVHRPHPFQLPASVVIGYESN